MTWEVRHADCIEAMRAMDEASVDAIVTDPPYGLEFMGKEWDRLATGRAAKYSSGGALITEEQIEQRRGKGGAGPSYVNRPAKRCKKCGKQAWSGSPCQCEQPEWELDNSPLHAAQEWHQAWATEALRILKPGGHLLAFGGTRTYHRLACAIEDAGFEIRDSLIWLYGSGFPKSLDVSKAIDKRPGVSRHAEFAKHLTEQREAKRLSRADVSEMVVGTRTGACWNWEHHQFPEAKWWSKLAELLDLDPRWGAVIAEAEREVVGSKTHTRSGGEDFAKVVGSVASPRDEDVTLPATPEAEKWNGWGTALKPGHEPIVMARKPLIGTVAQNVQAHGTGALNIDGCRIGTDDDLNGGAYSGEKRRRDEYTSTDTAPGAEPLSRLNRGVGEYEQPTGRWPANVILSEEAAAELDRQSGETRSAGLYEKGANGVGSKDGAASIPIDGLTSATYADSGGPSRYFYCAKASRGERNAGLDGFDKKPIRWSSGEQNPGSFQSDGTEKAARNAHPTVKPIDLMRWLCRLVTPPGGTILDPFTGSGTTGCAAVLEDFDFIGIEREAEYVEIAKARIEWWRSQPTQLTLT